jgi:hypothetical protein
MKKIALWLAVMALGLCLGCESSLEQHTRQWKERPDIHINLKFKERQIVKLKIGGVGQIIRIDYKGDNPYGVKMRSEYYGTVIRWFEEYELEVAP